MAAYRRLQNIFLTFGVCVLFASKYSSGYSQLTFDSIYLNITFENGADSILIFSSDTAGSSWQIGQPSKTYFSTSISPINAIVTDTQNYYLPNTNTWFEIPFVPGKYDSTSQYGFCPLLLCFKHMLETQGSLHAAAWVDVWDNNEYFNLGLLSDLTGNYYGYNQFYSENSYLPSDIMFNGEAGFNFSSLPETETCYTFYNWNNPPINTGLHDTLHFRFNFSTPSSISPIFDGWLIDDIRIGKGGYWACQTMEITNESQVLVSLYPNPVDNVFTLQLPFICKIGYCNVKDSQGRINSNFSIQNSESILFDISNLRPGMYYLEYHGDGYSAFKKLIKL